MLKRLLLALLCASALAASAQELLEPEQAFRFSARAIDATHIEARWQIADGYYMYRDKFGFALEGARLAKFSLPAGKIKEDETFGRVETYRKELKLLLTLDKAASANVRLQVQGQGCADLGVCYPPMKHTLSLKLPAAVTAAPSPPVPAAPLQAANVSALPATAATPPVPVAENDSAFIARLFGGSNTWLLLITFYGFGLLLSFTPCVLPMVPIISAIIVGHGHAITRRRAFALSSAYGLGMAVAYAAAGVAAGFTGTLISNALQNPWVLGAFALLFVALACAMFGLYELQLPSALQDRLSGAANRQPGSVAGTALTGALSAVILGPCVVAPLAGALLYIAQTGDALKGGLALFAMGLGMGLPLVAVGTFSRSLLPHSGPWMAAVKKFFGMLLLATALWIVSPVLPSWFGMLGWAALLIVSAIYLRAIDPLPPQAHGWQRFWKGIGIVLLLTGGAMLLGVLGGARDPLQPLEFLRGTLAAKTAPQFETVRSVAELEARLAAAKQPVMLDFYADWCVDCKKFERSTFPATSVASRLQRLTLLKVDMSEMSAEHDVLLKRFGLYGPPAILFFSPHGAELESLRVIGFQAPEIFIATLDRVLASSSR